MSSSTESPSVVGIYGIPGSGKTFTLDKLKHGQLSEKLIFFEGSEVIDSLCFGGLAAFKSLPKTEKAIWRQSAINSIRQNAISTGSMAIVTGHYMFWDEEDGAADKALTQDDLNTYTHIIHLDVPAHTLVERRKNDIERGRPAYSAEHLQKWQLAEGAELRAICGQNGIMFTKVCGDENVATEVENILSAFLEQTSGSHLTHALASLDAGLGKTQLDAQLRTVLMFDGDKTLISEDTGKIFWELARPDWADPLKALFSGPKMYTDQAFLQAALLYNEIHKSDFDELCGKVASIVRLRPELFTLLQFAAASPHTAAIVVTCGLQRVWELILQQCGLSAHVKVIGNGRTTDHSVFVTPETKAVLVRHLQTSNITVWGFGDGVVDIPMLTAANHAVVVVGGPSSSMETGLRSAISDPVAPLRHARQTLLPRGDTSISPRVDVMTLPIVDVTRPEFIREIFYPAARVTNMCINRNEIHHATALAASKLLATTQRDARRSGPSLREAHHQMGRYLALTLISELLGAEEVPGGIPHVQGHTTTGHRLRDEENTLIVALMRGGEPMAFGVNEVFPAAAFLHAKTTSDLKEECLEGIKTVLLVDSVINTGKSVVEFVQHMRVICGDGVRIIIVAGVVQAEAVAEGGMLAPLIQGDGMLDVVALRLSQNKFTGRGGTDTGNRLFNTTRLE
ncbi:uracil phosphoribosyltransferase-domain-containing protein [Echria macrotheca]|uniref:Uracil phosphoribosyltransferase-domain-containing protein n=1 Tax=Echria macrotheca TaxID=438768 RepID=A0AAJ0F2Q1_9PEZI|nr:uracil phosphoribosyltransferase-domain-containing protein [Echria macrotheca]